MNTVTDGYIGRHATQYVEDNKQGRRDIGQNGSNNGEEGVDNEQNGEGNG